MIWKSICPENARPSISSIAVLVEIGKHNPTVQKLWDRIPTEIAKVHKYQNALVGAEDFLPPSSEE